ncbi:hypothetical protein ADUPG1_008541 [Aduncisulcus paluster]|uniref:RRM domain-containing protein n=1 Tax=Aduncisulcus paluster TaxID=2918883 RepID=A0ABQ5KUQ1_9EUKA|nr:hypothetical protein ADUPG1_008541 [Aduncisulcus paluster]
MAPRKQIAVRAARRTFTPTSAVHSLYLGQAILPVTKIEVIIGIRCAKKGLRGCAFVSFQDEGTASLVMSKLDGFNFLGKKLIIERAKEPSAILR